jgi:predicted PurR-regulated permease PerM
MSLKEFFDLVILGVVLCVSIAIPFLWLNYSNKKKINKVLTWLIFLLLFCLLAWLVVDVYD